MAGDIIYLGEDRFSAKALKRMTEKRAVSVLKGHSKSQVINAWKIANGKTKPKFDPTEKPKPKKKKKEDEK